MRPGEARLSRPARSMCAGKCDQEVKTLVDEDTKSALMALAFASGVTVSEYVRDLLLAHIHGHAHLLRIAVQRGKGRAETGQ